MGRLANLKNALDTARRIAYHGSPHDFDKFSLTKIGTGEGAQAYGHGLYFSSSEDIADFYRNNLSAHLARDVDPAYKAAARSFQDAGYSREDAIKGLQQAYPDADPEDLKYAFDGKPGKLYTVEIPDESLMLDWDKPLSEQPENVQKVFREPKTGSFGRYEGLTGQQAYMKAQSEMGGAQNVSELWKQLGIPGITYKGATSDERNFVVFDDEMVNILQKGNATPGGMATAGGLAAGSEFVRRRANKTQTLKGLGEAAMTVGSGLVGGVIGDLSRLGGYLNPFMSVEDTERGAEALSGRVTYQPSQDAIPYLEPISRGLETFEQDINRGVPEGLREQWGRVHPRLRGIAETVLF